MLTPDDIDQILGKAKPACDASLPACMAQLGHALEADSVVSGTVRRNADDLVPVV